jgi:hypothetical protein
MKAKTSGAGLLSVGIAVAVAMGAGFLARRGDGQNRFNPQADYSPPVSVSRPQYTVEVVRTGVGSMSGTAGADVAAWAELDVRLRGVPTDRRPGLPVWAEDEMGVPLEAEMVWLEDRCFALVRPGFAHRTGSVKLRIGDEARPALQTTLPPLKDPEPLGEVDNPEGPVKDFDLEICRLKPGRLAVRAKHSLPSDRIAIVRYLGTNYAACAPAAVGLYLADALRAETSGTDQGQPTALKVRYSEDATALRFEILELRGIPKSGRMEHQTQVRSSTEWDLPNERRQTTFRLETPTLTPLSGDRFPARLDLYRELTVDDELARLEMRYFQINAPGWTASLVIPGVRPRLLSPRMVNGKPLQFQIVDSTVVRSGGSSRGGSGRAQVQSGKPFRVRFELEWLEFEMVRREIRTVPYRFADLPEVSQAREAGFAFEPFPGLTEVRRRWETKASGYDLLR